MVTIYSTYCILHINIYTILYNIHYNVIIYVYMYTATAESGSEATRLTIELTIMISVLATIIITMIMTVSCFILPQCACNCTHCTTHMHVWIRIRTCFTLCSLHSIYIIIMHIRNIIATCPSALGPKLLHEAKHNKNSHIHKSTLIKFSRSRSLLIHQ